MVAALREGWRFWNKLPDTADRFVNVSNVEEGIGVLPTLLLKKETYRSMAGGDGACMGCGEKTAVHLIVSSIEGMMRPRVERHVARLGEMVAALDARARELLASDVDLETLASDGSAERLLVPLDAEKRLEVERLARVVHDLKALQWRYAEGPSGHGRSLLAMANSTGCSSVWASTYPYNPYPFPWVNHLFQDSPSVAIGVFEGHMRKMADGFVTVRRAQAILDGDYDAERTERELADLDWRTFSDDEFALCPPIVAMGGDGAMLDIGFQNLSRLMASGKPIRVVVLDTQVYSNTGGQACTSGFTGQVADMSWYGKEQHGKTEVRKELALIAMAHRGVFVHQSSQASASHLMAGVLKGLQKRRPALFNIYTPCPVEHGLPDDWSQHSARLALESRAFPYLTFDPDAGGSWADCLSLVGNPSVEDDWPTYALEYADDTGAMQSMELPLTTADWAATEGRFRKHFKKLGNRRVPSEAGQMGIGKRETDGSGAEDLVRFDEYLGLSIDEREGKTPFIYMLGAGKKLERWSVALEIVRLAEERQLHWTQLRELAGVVVPQSTRDRVNDSLEAELQAKLDAAERDYKAKLAEAQAAYPTVIARRLAEGLLRGSNGGKKTIAELMATLPVIPGTPTPPASTIAAEPVAAAALPPSPGTPAAAPASTPPVTPAVPVASAASPAITAVAATPAPAVAPTAVPSVSPAVQPAPALAPNDAEAVRIDAYIDSDRCTTCNECTNLNKKMFAYNANKQAYIKDASAGTFAQLVMAAEKCPVSAIHPGTPLNPKEKDLEKWLKRAQAF
jgi:pyruvate-ferredoxin/flavodoxin oxidoreductase